MDRFLTLLFLNCSFSLFAQELIYHDPIRLSSDVNSPFEDINPLLTTDGKTIYFVRAFDPQNTGGQRAGLDIWYSIQNGNGSWSQASNKLSWNNKLNNAVVGIRKDDNVVYLLNAYGKKNGLSFSVNRNGEWTIPELIPIPGLEKSNFVGFYMNPSFNILIISMERNDSYGKEDLYVSLKDSMDRWSEPLNLGPTINSTGFETAPFLSGDGKRLYFTSDGHKGFGEGDIFVSERLYDNWILWSRPKNLGNKINSDKFDSYFSIYGDSLCFFSSNRSSDFSDIYQSKVELSKKAPLKDSVNRIIDEATHLLGELKTELGNPTAVEQITFPGEDNVLPVRLSNQIRQILTNYDLRLLAMIEIEFNKTKLNDGKSQSIIEYLSSLGISRSKINDKPNSSSINQDKFELRIYLKQKK